MGKWRYGIVLDAGSSGTRVHIYRWLNSARARQEATTTGELHSLPDIKTKKKWTKKIHPGISTYADKADLVGSDHLAPLLDHALDIIPASEIENTPIFLLATAGMRLLQPAQQKSLLQAVCRYTQQHTKFQLPDCNLHIQVIPGETEGLYGWIAANYLLGGFDHPEANNHGKGHHTYGFLDMGGASAQIAFAPNSTEVERHATDLKLLRLRTLDGAPAEYRVFTATWLGFGANEARQRFVSALKDTYTGIHEFPDPCLPNGVRVTLDGSVIRQEDDTHNQEPHLLGTGNFQECLKRTYPLLEKDHLCVDEPCLLHGIHTPAIDFDVNHFVGVSEYWYTTHEVFGNGKADKAYDFHTYQDQVLEFCGRPWSSLESGLAEQEWGKKVDESTLVSICFKASWLINMLHDGIGIPRVSLDHPDDHSTIGGFNGTKEILEGAKDKGFLDPFQAVDKIKGTEVSWTLGKMVLYAASQIPPENNDTLSYSLAVGFGTNAPGVSMPADFQFAGGSSQILGNDLTEKPASWIDSDDDVEPDWHDKLFTSNSSRRIPGFLLFLVILIIIIFFACRHDRHGAPSIFHRFTRSLFRRGPQPRGGTKRRAGLWSKVLGLPYGSHSPKYEAMAQDDVEMADPSWGNSLGLPAHHDSDSDSDAGGSSRRTGRTSGWTTPKLQVLGDHSPFPGLTTSSSGFFAGATDNDGNGGLDGAIPLGGPANAFERGGLTVRVDSREKLALKPSLVGRGISRTGSPARMRSPIMTPVKESMD